MKATLYVGRNPAVAARKFDGEMMIMSCRDSTLFILDEMGTTIWESANGLVTLAEIVASKICTDFDVQYERALLDAEAFAEALAERGIVLISSDPIPDPDRIVGLSA
jgi:hypothetical protein